MAKLNDHIPAISVRNIRRTNEYRVLYDDLISRITALENAALLRMTTATLSTTVGNSNELSNSDFATVVNMVANKTLVADSAGTIGIYTGRSPAGAYLVTTLCVSAHD